METDQKPLVSIYKKHMIGISPRVQRLIVRSFPYLPFKVVYKKGTDIPVADALSHVTPMDPEDNIQLPIIAVNMITTWILMSVESHGSFSNKLDQLRKSTAQDEQLTRLKGYIRTGFPCDKKNLPTDLHEFGHTRKCNLLSHGATFRMGVLLPNYPEENVVKSCGENVPNFKCNTSTGTSTATSSNVFQILQDLQLKQYQENHPDSLQNESRMSHTSTHSTTGTLIQNIAQPTTSFRINTPTKATTGEQVNPVQVSQDTSCKTHLESCMHVHQPVSQICKPGESLALRKVKHPLNGRTSVSRLPLTKQDILSQYSGCFEGIGHFPGDPYKFDLKPDHKPARHTPRKVPVHLETAFKEEIESLVKQGILEEVKEHTDWVNSYVIVEKDTGNHHSPNHTVKKKLRICLNPRDLNEALEREPYHTISVDEITTKLQGMTVFTIVDFKKGYWMVVLNPDSRKLTCMALPFGRFQ